jgi:adenylate kinase family enzyme
VTRPPFILALAGALASGKTTLSRIIAADTGATCVSFGDLVRSEAGARKVDPDRSSLQVLGSTLLDELGPSGLCERALVRAGAKSTTRPVIWDGVRHVPVLDALRELYAPDAVILVVLSPPEAARRRRFTTGTMSPEQQRAWEVHESENNLEALTREADLVCEATWPSAAATEVLKVLTADDRLPPTPHADGRA